MWIEVSHAGKRVLINAESITLIEPDVGRLIIIVMSHGAGVDFEFECAEDLNAYYNGFNLALNGLEFHFKATDTLPSGFIRPLLRSKNEALYKHILLKEVLGERR